MDINDLQPFEQSLFVLANTICFGCNQQALTSYPDEGRLYLQNLSEGSRLSGKLGTRLEYEPESRESQRPRHQISQQWQGGQSVMVLDPMKSLSQKVHLKVMQSLSRFIPC